MTHSYLVYAWALSLVPTIGKKMLPKRTFVLGGAASGKSVWAERLVESHDLPMVYIATGRIFDAEVAEKVEAAAEKVAEKVEAVAEKAKATVKKKVVKKKAAKKAAED